MARIYMDNAATTALSGEALEEMLPYFAEHYGNPSSIHTEGRKVRRGVEKARQKVAQAIGAEAGEVFFTAGGSESDNWALRGVLLPLIGENKKHVITSSVEHHAILHTLDDLEKQGWQVTRLPVDGFGQVSAEAVREAIRPDTALISVMAANNEVGTLQPVQEIGCIARAAGVLFHTDAVQAAGSLPIDVKAWNVDLLSLSGHKFHGPKGVGALYVRKGVRIAPLITGGAQEKALRAGTENVPAIVGMGEALRLAEANRPETAARLEKMRNRLIAGLMARVENCRLNGHPEKRLPGNVNICFPGVEGESLLMRLDLAGIAASAGSACTSGSLESSHVLRAMGLDEEEAKGSLRLSLSGDNTDEEIDRVLEVLPAIVAELRSLRS
ncbi:MAG: cysteine desulfurase NifS [Clostridiales bacterium]|nr:cysteine desulfurase NifS [Clostridiales bacterium]